MHELAVTEHLLKTVLKRQEEENLKKIISISLTVGNIQNYEEDWIRKYFEYMSKDTPAEGATIIVKRVPVVIRCNKCGNEFTFDVHSDAKMVCPECDVLDCKLISGKEFYIDSMEAI